MQSEAKNRLKRQIDRLLRAYVDLLGENRLLKKRLIEMQQANVELAERNKQAAEKNRQALQKIQQLEKQL